MSADDAAAALNTILARFVAMRRLPPALPKDIADWNAEVKRLATALLACFGGTPESPVPDDMDALNADIALGAGDPAGTEAMAVPWDGDRAGQTAETLRGLASIVRRATRACEGRRLRDAGGRPRDDVEVSFFAHLASFYRHAFGQDWSISRRTDQRPDGTAIRFCRSVLRALSDRHVPDGNDDAEWLKRVRWLTDEHGGDALAARCAAANKPPT